MLEVLVNILHSQESMFSMNKEDTHISYLPLAHMFERVVQVRDLTETQSDVCLPRTCVEHSRGGVIGMCVGLCGLKSELFERTRHFHGLL